MKKLLVFSFIFYLLMINCDDKNPIVPIQTVPVLSRLLAPQNLYLLSKSSYPLSIRVDDPQGIRDIESVICHIWRSNESSPFKQLNLVDDGTLGDIIPMDGIYTTLLSPLSLFDKTGEYTFEFKAADKSGNESNTVMSEILVLDGEGNSAPILTNINAPLIIHIEDTTDYIITAQVSDPQGLTDIQRVQLQAYPPNSATPLLSENLRDDGQSGDSMAVDGIYTLAIDPKFSRSLVGKFTLRIQAFDRSGEGSDAATHVLDVVKAANNPPYIFNLQAANILQRVSGYVVIDTIRISVTDPQGLTDVRDVYFRSFKPDGREAQNSPIHLSDDGNKDVNGDQFANDGVYSIIIQLPFETQPGNYTFIFEAVDKSNAKSNRMLHTLEVI